MAQTSPPKGKLFAAVARESTLSDKVAGLLLDTILSGKLQPGERLPSERELGEQFGVSRTVVREAVRSLAAKGAIEVRSGSGLRVAAVGSSAVRESMMLFFRGAQSVSYEDLHEVREMLEVQTAMVAAQRATAEDIADLMGLYREMESAVDDLERAAVVDVEFHRTIAKATRNELYLVLLDSMSELLLEARNATLGLPERPHQALAYHREILDQIAAHDPEGAQRAMRRHLDESVAVWRELNGKQPADS